MRCHPLEEKRHRIATAKEQATRAAMDSDWPLLPFRCAWPREQGEHRALATFEVFAFPACSVQSNSSGSLPHFSHQAKAALDVSIFDVTTNSSKPLRAFFDAQLCECGAGARVSHPLGTDDVPGTGSGPLLLCAACAARLEKRVAVGRHASPEQHCSASSRQSWPTQRKRHRPCRIRPGWPCSRGRTDPATHCVRTCPHRSASLPVWRLPRPRSISQSSTRRAAPPPPL